MEDLADTRLVPKISQLPGVGLVSISGGQKPAVRIQANPTALGSYGLNLEDLRNAINAANVNQAKGNFDGAHQAYQIGANDQLLSSDEYGPLIIAYRNNGPVRISDVATVVDDTENIRQAAWMNESPAVIVNIQRQPGANIIAVVDRVKALLPQLQTSLPSSIQVKILTDRTNTIRASVSDVQFELMLTIGLVVLVIFLFLRNLSATIIPSVAVPLSLVGTFGVMYLLGYSLNNLSLMALTISTGFVVDDAIVMIENISRYLEEGKSPLQAALLGSEQIGFTIVSLTVSLIAVLIPLLFMGDIVGRLVPRVRRDVERDHPGFGHRFADADADDVRQDFEAHAREPARLVLPRFRTRIRRGDRAVCQDAALGVAESATDVSGGCCHVGSHICFVHQDPERLLPGPGYRRHSGSFRSRADHLLPRHVPAAASAGESDSAGPGGGEHLVVHRHRRNQHHAQHRAHPDQPEAARGTQDERERRDPALAAGADQGCGHHAVHAAGAGSDRGGSRQPHAVSIHAGRSQRRRAEFIRSENGGASAKNCPSCATWPPISK